MIRIINEKEPVQPWSPCQFPPVDHRHRPGSHQQSQCLLWDFQRNWLHSLWSRSIADKVFLTFWINWNTGGTGPCIAIFNRQSTSFIYRFQWQSLAKRGVEAGKSCLVFDKVSLKAFLLVNQQCIAMELHHIGHWHWWTLNNIHEHEPWVNLWHTENYIAHALDDFNSREFLKNLFRKHRDLKVGYTIMIIIIIILISTTHWSLRKDNKIFI